MSPPTYDIRLDGVGFCKIRREKYATEKSTTNLLNFLFFFHRRPFTFTPLEKGSPYDAATLGFIFLAVRGAFLLEPMEAFTTGNFQLKEEAKQWPLLCHIDQSSGTTNVSITIGTCDLSNTN